MSRITIVDPLITNWTLADVHLLLISFMVPSTEGAISLNDILGSMPIFRLTRDGIFYCAQDTIQSLNPVRTHKPSVRGNYGYIISSFFAQQNMSTFSPMFYEPNVQLVLFYNKIKCNALCY